MNFLAISCSLNRKSRSRILAEIAVEHLRARGGEGELIDLATLDLPLCDAGACYSHPQVQALAPRIEQARGIIIAAPIYNYDLNAAAKNLIELTGQAWAGKVVGFVCAAGGHGSYMSIMPFANSLMLDFRCLIIPRFVYAPRAEIDDETYGDAAINRRVDGLAEDLVKVAGVLS